MSNRYLDWFRQAEADLQHARNSFADGDYEWSCFAAHQAAEKALISSARSPILPLNYAGRTQKFCESYGSVHG